MKFAKTLLVSAALVASFGASADVVGSKGGGFGTFLTLAGPTGVPCTSATCTLTGSGTAGTIAGGTLYAADREFADIPSAIIPGTLFLAAGPTSTSPSTLTFASAVNYISFLWGSPDTYNLLTVNSAGASQTFDIAGTHAGTSNLGFASTNGSQSFSQYVQFVGTGITSLVFTNSLATDAFETANFSVVAAVPEPETYALMLASLGALGFVWRRRRPL